MHKGSDVHRISFIQRMVRRIGMESPKLCTALEVYTTILYDLDSIQVVRANWFGEMPQKPRRQPCKASWSSINIMQGSTTARFWKSKGPA